MSSRGALPSFRVKDSGLKKLKQSANASGSATFSTSTATQSIPATSTTTTAMTKAVAEKNPPSNPPAAQRTSALTAPPSTFAGDVQRQQDKSGAVIYARVAGAPVAEPLLVVDKRGNVRDGWEVFGQAEARDRSDARLKKQRDKEARQRARDHAKEGRNVRLDEDKSLFLESLERSMKHMVATPDESVLRRPEELTDAEILGLQKRAYRWKRENRLLKELLYTQYVIAQKK